MSEINLFRHAREVEERAAGDVLFREGETGDVMFAVVDGEVELIHAGRVIDTLGPGGILGEMALVDSSPRSAAAVVKVPSRIARVNRREFTFLVHEHPTFALEVMGVLADRLRRANDPVDQGR